MMVSRDQVEDRTEGCVFFVFVLHHMPFRSIIFFSPLTHYIYYVNQKRNSANHRTLISSQELEKFL